MVLDIKFVGIEPTEKPPKVAVFVLDPSGRVVRKLTSDKDGKLDLDPALARERLAALGPDVDPDELERNALMQFWPQELLPQWERLKAIQIPRDWWLRWRFLIVCVNGRVRKCSFLFPPLPPPGPFPLPHPPFPPPICWPICNGVVEIYERTCCCRPPVVVDIPPILQRLREIMRPILRWPPPPPPPELIRIRPPVAMDRLEARRLKQAEAFDQVDYSAPPNEQLRTDFLALERMQPADAAKYLGDRPYLWPIWCRCTTRKVGEAVLGPDGRFHFCYRKFAFPNPLCRTYYYYKVRQWQDTGWVTIYDGDAAHRYYSASDFAEITTFLGRGCGQPPPVPTGPKPNVMLQDIGLTHSYNLVSHYMGKDGAGKDLTQTGQYTLAAPVADGGLVNPPYDAPWGKTLSFRLWFHPDLKALGAVYYRVSIVAADASGAPAGGATPTPITNGVSWLKFVIVGTHYTVAAETLGPETKTVGGNPVTGLCKIPYDADALWLGGQYHQTVDTTGYANGRHLIVVEVFDTNGVRLRPAGATDAGTDANFEFQRWLVETGPDSTAVVPFAALTHIFWFDNRPVYADIEDLRRNHLANTQECQFMTGPAATEFSVGFRAFHAASGDATPPPQTFMDSFQLWWHRGLNGPTVQFQHGNTNQPNTLLAGAAAESNTVTFGTLLGPNTKCTFAVNLNVYAKHTNGIGRLSEYDRYDEAAFAVEVTP